jgi:hypothetical protein
MITKFGTYIMIPEPISMAYLKIPPICLSLLGSVNTLPRQRMHAKIEMLDTSFSVRSVPYKRKSVYPLTIARQARSRGHEILLEASFSMRSASYQSKVDNWSHCYLCVPPIFLFRFLCGSCHIKQSRSLVFSRTSGYYFIKRGNRSMKS